MSGTVAEKYKFMDSMVGAIDDIMEEKCKSREVETLSTQSKRSPMRLCWAFYILNLIRDHTINQQKLISG